MREIDCRGLACPQPVLNTKDALEEMETGTLKVVVDNQPAVGNVTRFAQSQGCLVEHEPQGSDFLVTITKGGVAGSDTAADEAPRSAAKPKVVIRVSRDTMGDGDDELGRILMKAFIKTLKDATNKPDAIVFYNGGVKLTVQGSELIDDLRSLDEGGSKVFSCGTCLDFFGIKDQLAVGAVSNMFEIVETLSGADRVVSP